MKYIRLLICLLLTAPLVHAQGKKATTIVLLRHAEKDVSTNPADPPLSAAGKERAQKLPRHLKALKPDAFYSTNTTRTRETLRPWATQRHKQVILYDAARQGALADSLKKQGGKTFVIVGHSNTIPGFVNQLTGTTSFRDLPDSEYGHLWIVTINNGKARVREDSY